MQRSSIKQQEHKSSVATSNLPRTKMSEDTGSKDGQRKASRSKRPYSKRGGPKRVTGKAPDPNPNQTRDIRALNKMISTLKKQVASLQRKLSVRTKGVREPDAGVKGQEPSTNSLESSTASKLMQESLLVDPFEIVMLAMKDQAVLQRTNSKITRRAKRSAPKPPKSLNRGTSPLSSKPSQSTRGSVLSRNSRNMSASAPSLNGPEPPSGNETEHPKDSVNTNVITAEKSKDVLRKVPMASGSSLDVTLKLNKGVTDPKDPQSVLPKKSNTYVRFELAKPKVGGPDLRHKNITMPKLRFVPGKILPKISKPEPQFRVVEKELYGFLIYEHTLQPRTAEVMGRMVAKGKRFLSTFDLTNYSHLELHAMLVQAVESAMHVPLEEMAVRRSLQDVDSAHNRLAHADMVRDGILGLAATKTPRPFNLCFAGNEPVRLPSKRV